MSGVKKVIEKLEKAMMLSEAANECGVVLGYGTVEDVIALLKAQEPVEPKRKLSKRGWFSYCPRCDIVIRDKQRFCAECGQAVKWE